MEMNGESEDMIMSWVQKSKDSSMHWPAIPSLFGVSGWVEYSEELTVTRARPLTHSLPASDLNPFTFVCQPVIVTVKARRAGQGSTYTVTTSSHSTPLFILRQKSKSTSKIHPSPRFYYLPAPIGIGMR